MNFSVHSEYTSIACNRIPAIADWNSDGIICYGATNAVILYDTNIKDKDPLTTLSYHKARVNSVKWLKHNDGRTTELLSCSNDKMGAIWSKVDGKWSVTGVLGGHTEGATCVDGLYMNGDNVIMYTASIDSTVRVWERTNGETSCLQTISLGSGLCLTLKAHLLSKIKRPILFCALDDQNIHIFASPTVNDSKHHRLHILSGHEDWVRGLDIMDIGSNGILIASSSQDTYIRLWRIQEHIPNDAPTIGIKLEEKLFTAYSTDWSVKLDAVLAGHEGWVYGVQWHPPVIDKVANYSTPVYRLLSSSLDKTLIIWEPDVEREENRTEDSGVWVERVRVGEVGGNGLGFYGSKFGPNGKSFMGHGYNGSFHIWKLNEDVHEWQPMVVCGGHYAEVSDVRWEPRGRYIASVSADQTTRIHAHSAHGHWHEVARPQVHGCQVASRTPAYSSYLQHAPAHDAIGANLGYDMSSIALVSSSMFVSSAEEKVIRVFEAPQNFIQNFKNFTGEDLLVGTENIKNGPEGASVPSLGLSNKAVFKEDNNSNSNDRDNDIYFVPINLSEPPTEETLMQNTLWPEVYKLYGHGYEVYSLDTTSDGSLVASSCRATASDHAAILIWETKTWQQIQKLVSHQLTVTQLTFSPNSRQLVSVSRDRKWTLFQREQGGNSFEIIASTDKTNGIHTRIIWCCAWAHDGLMFATGSREGKVCVWSKTDTISDTSLKQHSILGKPLEMLNMSATAVAFAPKLVEHSRIIAVGLENGYIRLYSFLPELEDCWSLKYLLDNSTAHHLTVKKLLFKPIIDEESILLASCGSDHLVRIYNISVKC